MRSDKNELSQHSLHRARFSSIKRSVYNGLPVTTHSTDDHSIKFLKYVKHKISPLSNQNSLSVYKTRFCALPSTFQSRWQNWKISTGSVVIARFVKFVKIIRISMFRLDFRPFPVGVPLRCSSCAYASCQTLFKTVEQFLKLQPKGEILTNVYKVYPNIFCTSIFDPSFPPFFVGYHQSLTLSLTEYFHEFQHVNEKQSQCNLKLWNQK